MSSQMETATKRHHLLGAPSLTAPSSAAVVGVDRVTETHFHSLKKMF